MVGWEGWTRYFEFEEGLFLLLGGLVGTVTPSFLKVSWSSLEVSRFHWDTLFSNDFCFLELVTPYNSGLLLQRAAKENCGLWIPPSA